MKKDIIKVELLITSLVINVSFISINVKASNINQAVKTEYSSNKAFNKLNNTKEKNTYNLISKECRRVTKDKSKVFKARKINYNKYKIGYNRIQKVVSAINIDYPEYYFF